MQPIWHALYVKANHEKRVSQYLAAHSVDHYLPLCAQPSQWSDRKVLLQRPVFPGYVFVRFAGEQRKVVLGAPGAVCLVGEDKLGTITFDDDVESLRQNIIRSYEEPDLGIGRVAPRHRDAAVS